MELPNGSAVNGTDADDLEADDILVLYATETGSAQDAADRIARHVRRAQYKARVFSMEDYRVEDLITEPLVIFVISTTGTGAQPRMMTPMWNMLLRSDLPSDLFEETQFAVFGLGDTSYDKFCWPAKKLCRRLENLGGQMFMERGEGDEQDRAGIDGALDPWMDDLVEALGGPPPSNAKAGPSFPPPPARARVTAVDDVKLKRKISSESALKKKASSDSVGLKAKPSSERLSAGRKDPEQWRWPVADVPGYYEATLSANERITAEGWNQDVRHFEFDFDDDIQYVPGDAAVVHPEVDANEVDDFLATNGWKKVADKPFRVSQAMSDQTFPAHLPSVVTLRLLFTRYLDFTAIPRRSFFQFILHFTSDEREREKLEEFVGEEGADDLYEYCYFVRRNIKEVLEDFHSVKIPTQYVFDVFPPLRPREFSMASSIQKHPQRIQLCVAIVRYKTKMKAPRKGVCTTYMANFEIGDKIYMSIRKGFIPRFPPSTPLIGVGPGTGLAPIRALVEERLTEQPSTSTTFYFGCRSATKDQHYASQMTNYARDPSRQFSYRVACSRDGPEGVKRTYVQDLIYEDKERVWRLIEGGAALVISGASNKMPAGVREAVRTCMMECTGCDEEAAVVYVERMEKEGRLIEDCWS